MLGSVATGIVRRSTVPALITQPADSDPSSTRTAGGGKFFGYVANLWLTYDQHGVYRGLYEWDGPARAESYARCLWRVLELPCVPGSIHYRVLPRLRLDDALHDPRLLDVAAPADPTTWRRLVEAA